MKTLLNYSWMLVCDEVMIYIIRICGNRRILFLTVLLLFRSAAYGSAYWGGYKGYGEPATVYDARLLGMGAASIAISDNGAAVFNNPAGLILSETPPTGVGGFYSPRLSCSCPVSSFH